MTEFIVMETEIISDKDKRHVAGHGTVSQKVRDEEIHTCQIPVTRTVSLIFTQPINLHPGD